MGNRIQNSCGNTALNHGNMWTFVLYSKGKVKEVTYHRASCPGAHATSWSGTWAASPWGAEGAQEAGAEGAPPPGPGWCRRADRGGSPPSGRTVSGVR